MNIREINVMRVIITILKYVIKMVRKTSTLFQINLLGERLYESNFVFKVSPFGRIYWLIQ